MPDYSIAVVDDEEAIRDSILMSLEDRYRMIAYATAEKAFSAMRKAPPDLILMDIGLPGMSGLEALKKIKREHPEVLVIMITAYEDIDTVISAMKAGAHDYVVKPLHMEGLEISIGNALETIRLRKEVKALQSRYLEEHIPCFIGESKAIREVMEFIKTVARSQDTPVLIQGETGTGKELIAAAIHYNSPHWKAPFATVNCAAIPKDLIESELFGYARGAFSGASADGKQGLVEAAANGTLFLDEVGDLSPQAQAKLLRFLESGEFYRLGGSQRMEIKTRVVSATNRDLVKMMAAGDFRKDLYFRLGVVRVKIPSLNERPDDVLPLAKHFLKEFSERFGKKFSGISTEAQQALLHYNWTGNVRELKNVMEAAVLVARGPELLRADLEPAFPDGGGDAVAADWPDCKEEFPEEGFCLTSRLAGIEKRYIQKALRVAGGNESQAARLLGMNHHTFRYRRKKLSTH
ncbi:MAG: sigma-54 dependent transcriptional regulator [Deltaproteobacteria bacterium]|nr:sigma-54 dependent transcriptional regulator [Deltaproteobacteria bacterium]